MLRLAIPKWAKLPLRSGHQHTSLEIIRWWEKHRIRYNLLVDLAGVLCGILCIVCAFVSDAAIGETIGLSDGPLLGVFLALIYGVMANVCYIGGWIVELLTRALYGVEKANRIGFFLCRFGFAFSILVTLLPAAGCWLLLIFSLLMGKPHSLSKPTNE